MVAKIRTIDFLPEIFQTTPNKNFLSATLDQLVQQPDLEKLQGYIGRRFEYGITSNSYYIPEINKVRQNYQLEPAVIFTKSDTSKPTDFITYPEILDALKLEGAPITNNSLLFENQFYSWDSFVDLDKLSNFSQYYWLPNGPDQVQVEPLNIPFTSFIDAVSEINYYRFVRDNSLVEGFNPTITLLRGGTYYFNINQKDSKFYIQTLPGTSGTDPTRNNVTTRDIFGLDYNGISQGTIKFEVPLANAQENQTYEGNVNVDLVTTQAFELIHGQRLSTVQSIDNVTNLRDKTLLFYETSPNKLAKLSDFYDEDLGFDNITNPPVGFDSYTEVFVNKTFFKITYLETDEPGDPVLSLVVSDEIPSNTNITVLAGYDYINKKFVKTTEGVIQEVPEITAPLDTLYYQDSVNPLKFGTIKLVDSSSANFIDVNTDIIGKETYLSPNNVKFTNGLKVSFAGNIIPEFYRNRQFYVEGVGQSINLIPVERFVNPEKFTQSVYNAYDIIPYDMTEYSEITQQVVNPDYITISRNSRCLDPWSRSNRWFHYEVIQETIKHTASKTLQNAANNDSARAKRPIIEFYPNLKLFNSGTEFKDLVDYFDVTSTNALTEVAGKLQYYPDGDSFGLFDKCKIVFSADTNKNVRNKIYEVNFVSLNPQLNLQQQVTNASSSNNRLTVQNSSLFEIGAMVSLRDNYGGLYKDTQYYVYDRPTSTTIRLSTTSNLSSVALLSNDTTTTIIIQSPPIIVLTESSAGNVLYNEQLVVLLGETKAGDSYYFDGVNYILAQEKVAVNQPPLFDIFDSNGLSFADTDYYNSSNFVGSSLFEFAVGTGPDDPVLGFPLKYSSVNNIGDISFNVSYNTTSFTYLLNGISTEQQVNQGYPYIYISRTDFTKQIGWQTAASNSIQYQAFEFDYFVGVDEAVFVCDVPAQSQDAIVWPTVKVFVNEQFLFANEFTYTVENNNTTVTLFSNPLFDTKIQILIYSDVVSQKSYYTIPTNLENNVFNGEIKTLNLGDIKNHYLSICVNSNQIEGKIFGANNYRDLPNLVSYGTKIIQNSAPLALTGALLKNKNYNLIEALNYNSNEYIKFKNLLVDTVNNNEYEVTQTASYILDDALNIISSYKNQSSPFFWSDMIPNRSILKTNTYTFGVSIFSSSFTLSRIYDFTSANYYGLLIYLKREVNGKTIQRQLLKDVDYTVSVDEPKVTISLDLLAGDSITINEYNQTYGSFVPNTPTKLGFYAATVPEIVLDTTYLSPTYFIKGHDGSLTSLYGDYENNQLIDYRDKVLFEFECRIYNNLKVSNTIPISSDEVLPGQFRNTKYNYDEIINLYSLSFLNWVGKNRIDYKQQYYDATNPFTYNYLTATNRLDGTLMKRGNWRGMYNWFFDTTTPNLTPWEMIGYTNKPIWWEEYYGSAPYTKDNDVLWDDMENGYDYNNGNPRTIDSRKRPGLKQILPVDSLGNLVNPMDSVVGNYDQLSFKTSWKVNDWGSAEYSYIKSSTWPFDLLKLLVLCKPAKFFSLCVNLDEYKFSTEFNQYLIDNKFRFTGLNAVLYGSGTAQHSYLNWIVDYIQSTGNLGYDVLSVYLNNLDVRLVYRLAGFSDKNLLKFYVDKGTPNSLNNSLLIPDESYSVLLHENQPFDNITYSSIIIQKTVDGYKVYGNSQNKIYFKTSTPLKNGKYDTITAGSLSVKVAKNFNTKEIVVPYGNEFTSIQALAEFINCYGNYLNNQGLIFDQVENSVLLNWNSMIFEVLTWAQSGWEVGAILNINPMALKLVIEKENAIIQPLTIQNQNYILNQNLIPIQIKDLSIIRDGTNFTAVPLTSDDTVAYFTGNLSNFEHAIIFDNTTLFNDLIFDPLTGLRQYRILLKGSKTATWEGTVDTKGFILNLDNVQEWSPSVKYTKGIIVKYKSNYYAANSVIQPNPTFQQGSWTKVDYEEIQKGLLPNASNRAYESTLYYDSYSANLENDADLLAFSLIGYRPRNYLVAANLDDISQVNLYKTMIVEKGSNISTSAIQNIKLHTGGIDYQVYENWAINLGSYGGLNNSNFIEFKLEEQKLNNNPNIVAVINGESEQGSSFEIPLNAITNYRSTITGTDILPLLKDENYSGLPSAGYVNFNDVKVYSFKISGLNLNTDIYNLYKNEYIWIADFKNDWRIYSINSLIPSNGINAKIVNVVNNLNNTATLFFDNPHNLVANDIILILYYADPVDGFYTVNKIVNLNSIIVDLILPSDTLAITSIGLVAKLDNRRVPSPADISTLNLTDTEFLKNTIWVDNDVDDKWAVYRKSLNYKNTNFIKPETTSTFGNAVAYSPILGYFAADSGTGKLYRYVYDSLVNSYTLVDTISNGIGYGTNVVIKNNIMVVSKTTTAPTSTIWVYELVKTNNIEGVALQAANAANTNPLVTYSTTTIDKIALSDNTNYLFLSKSSTRQIFVYRKNSSLSFISIGYALASSIQAGASSFTVSGNRLTLLTEGQFVSFTNVDSPTTYRVITGEYSSGPNITTFFIDGKFETNVASGTTIYRGYYGYTSVATITGTGAATGFGLSLATNYDGTKLYVGAPNQDYLANTDIGVVYVYDRIRQVYKQPNNLVLDTQLVITLAWTPTLTGTAIRVLYNDSVLSSSDYTLSTNILTIKIQVNAGDIIVVESSDFILTQTLTGYTEVPNPRVGMLYGSNLDATVTGNELLISAPYDIRNETTQEGTVYRYTNEGKSYGIIKGTSTYNLSTQKTILLNGYSVILPNTGITDAITTINNSNIPNIMASKTDDNKLIIQLINQNLNLSSDKLNLAVFDSADLTSLGITIYQKTQFLQDYKPQNSTLFGQQVKFNELGSVVITAPASNRYSPTVFDFTDDENFTNDTIFDNNFTTFIDVLFDVGSAYLYDYLPAYNENITNVGKFVLSQIINDTTLSYLKTPYYGYALAFNNYNILIGSPSYKVGAENGKINIFTNLEYQTNYAVYRKPVDEVDIKKINTIQLYNNLDNLNITSLDYIDPLQGKLFGVVRENLDFIAPVDPAGYNIDGSNKKIVWGKEYLGKLWFDLSQVKFVNYHQNDTTYNSKYWATVFPDSVVSVYTWIESDQLPINYTGTGQINDPDAYTTLFTVTDSGVLVAKYYYWVKNIGTILDKTKTLPDNVISEYIKNPLLSGISFFAPLKTNVFGLYNINTFVGANYTSIHIGFKTATSEDTIHNEYQLVRENYKEDFLPGIPTLYNSVFEPSGLYKKFLDSFAGVDSLGQEIPNPFLPKLLQAGTDTRPNQSFFYNRLKALENYCQYANSVMLQYPITELKNPSFLTLGGLALTGTNAPAFFTLTGEYFDTNNFWEFVDWWAEGYSDSTKTDIEVEKYYDLEKLTPYSNMIVGVQSNSNGKREVYIYKDTNWERIGLQEGTIQIKSSLYNYSEGGFGFGDSFFDSTPFDYFPSQETLNIIRGLNEEVYTEDLQIHRNKSLILMFNYILTESDEFGNYIPWLNKTSFLDVEHTLRELVQSKNFQRDNEDFLLGYINEVKPYRVKLKEFSLKYSRTDLYDGNITDFDLPAQWNSDQNTFVTPELVFGEITSPSQYNSDDSIWKKYEYNQWYNNYGVKLLDSPNYIIGKLKEYVPIATTYISVDNAFGYPSVGVIKLDNEFIGYTNIDRDKGILTGLTRGANDTEVADHIPNTNVYIDLPAVSVLDTGRGYTEPPNIVTRIDTSIYPEPKVQAALQAEMSGDKVIGVTVLNPGEGYKVLPEIIVEPSVFHYFNSTDINFSNNTINVPIYLFVTGDLVQYKKEDNASTILGLVDKAFYYIRLVEYGLTNPIVTDQNKNSLTAIALYTSKINAINDVHRISLVQSAVSQNHSFNISARLIPISSNTPTRQITPKLKFDRTSYKPVVQEWKSNQFYVAKYNSFGNDASIGNQLAESIEFVGVTGATDNLGTGGVFNVYNWVYGGANNPPFIWSNGPQYGIYTVSINSAGINYQPNDIITILGADLGGTTPLNNAVISVQSVNFAGAIQSAYVTGLPPVVYNTSLQGATLPITSVSTDPTTFEVTITVDYDNSSLSPGNLYRKQLYFYNLANLTTPYVYDTSGSGGAIIWVTSPTFNGVTVSNQYTIDIKDYGSTYSTGDSITILGTFLGGATPANDLKITITFAYLGEIVFYRLDGVCAKAFDQYFVNPINTTQLKLYNDYQELSPVKNTVSNPFIFSSSSLLFLPEPLRDTGSASLVSYNNKLYRCIESNTDSTFDITKWEFLTSDFAEINALDRVVTYYQPTIDMPGKNLPLLMSGLEYPNSTFLANKFDKDYELDVILKGEKFYPRDIDIKSIVFDGVKYIAVGNTPEYSIALYSTDGKNWTWKKISPQSLQVTDINYSGSYYIVTSLNSPSPILISYDGYSWVSTGEYTVFDDGFYDIGGYDTLSVGAPQEILNSSTYYNNLYVAVGETVISSTNATEWNTQFSFGSQLPNTIKSVTFVDGILPTYQGFIAVGYGLEVIADADTAYPLIENRARVLLGLDGSNWSKVDIKFDAKFNTVCSSLTTIVAAGENAQIYWSNNGTNWFEAEILGNVSFNINYGVYANGTFVLVGDNGNILYSGEGHQWFTTNPITNQNLNQISYDGTYFIAVGENSTILRSRDVINWENVSLINSLVPIYEVKGDSFLSGYGPEEMVPAVVYDNLSMTVKTSAGSLWDPTAYEHFGFKVARAFVSLDNNLSFSFKDLVDYPTKLALYIVNNSTGRGTRIYETIPLAPTSGSLKISNIDWVNKTVRLVGPISSTESLYVEVYEIGSGNQQVKGTSDSYPLQLDTATNRRFINTNYPYNSDNYLYSIVFINSVKQTLNVDYSIEPNPSGSIKIVFKKSINVSTDFVSFALFGDTSDLSHVYEYCIPETQTFWYVSGPKTFTLTNFMGGTNVANSVVEINGLRQRYGVNYTISGSILTIISALTTNSIVSITSFNDTYAQSFVTDYSNTLRVTPINYVNTPSTPVVVTTIVNPNLIAKDAVLIDGVRTIPQINNNVFYVKPLPTYVESAITYYPFELYLDFDLAYPVIGNTYGPYFDSGISGGGFIWKSSTTFTINQPSFDITDVERLFVTVNGTRVTANNLRINQPNNKLSIMTRVNVGDVVLVTSYMPSATPNELWYTMIVNRKGQGSVYNSNFRNRTWLERPLYPTDTKIYVKEVEHLVDLTVLNQKVLLDQNTQKYYTNLNYNVKDVKEVSVLNLTTNFNLSADDFYITTTNSVTQIIFTNNVSLDNNLQITIRFGNSVLINGEKIMFNSVDYQNNTLSGLHRGVDGTAVLNEHPIYSNVYSLSAKDVLDPFFYDKTWNTENYTPDGDPLQLSTSIPANFLKND